MKTFFGCVLFLMYAFLAYLWLLFITAILDRPRFLNHSLLEAGVILIGTILFFAVPPFLSFACQNKCQSNRGDRRFCLVMAVHFLSFRYADRKRRISDDTRQLRLKKAADEACVYFILIIPISQLCFNYRD